MSDSLLPSSFLQGTGDGDQMVPFVSASPDPLQIPDTLIVQLPRACLSPALHSVPHVTTCPSLIPLAPPTMLFWAPFYRLEEMGDRMWLTEGHKASERRSWDSDLDLLRPIYTLSTPCPPSWSLRRAGSRRAPHPTAARGQRSGHLPRAWFL